MVSAGIINPGSARYKKAHSMTLLLAKTLWGKIDKVRRSQ